MENSIDMIFRKVKSGELKGTVMAFIPDMPVNYGNIGLVDYCGHGEANLMYYLHDTVPAKPEEYAGLFKELDALYCHMGDGHDFGKINVRKRLNYDKLCENWRGKTWIL